MYRRLCRFSRWGVHQQGGVVAALFLISILVLIVAQMVARWTSTTRSVGPPITPATVWRRRRSLPFAHALSRGAHIRVSLLLNALGSKEILAGGVLLCRRGQHFQLRGLVRGTGQRVGRTNSMTSAKARTRLLCGFRSWRCLVGSVLLALCFWDNLVSACWC